MDSILKNIISNALKYTPDYGHVSVCVTETKDSWKVKVSDTGIGIPAKEKKENIQTALPWQQCHQF